MTESPRRTTLSMPAVVAISLFGCAMSPTHAQVMRTSIDSSGAVTVTVYEIPGSCDQALVNEARRSFQLDDDIFRSRSDPRAPVVRVVRWLGMDVSTSMISCVPVRRARAEGAGGSAGRE